MTENKTLLIILSLVIAVFLWIYVMGEVDPETKIKVSGVSVKIENIETLEENDLTVLADNELKVNVSLRGRRSEVNEAKKDGINASIDVSQCEEGVNSCKVYVNLPSGIKMENISKDTLKVRVEELVESEMNVTIEFTGNNSESNGSVVPWVKSINPEQIVIRGAKSAVEKVDRIRGTINKSDVDTTETSKKIEIMAVDKKSNEVIGITMDREFVTARVQQVSVKTVALVVSSRNVQDGVTVTQIKYPETLQIAGTQKKLSEIESIKGEVDLSNVDESGEYTVDMIYPDGIYPYNMQEKITAEITLLPKE